jgi:hypothetical protein
MPGYCPGRIRAELLESTISSKCTLEHWGSGDGPSRAVDCSSIRCPSQRSQGAYCLLASSAMTVGRDVPFGSTTEVKIPLMCFMSLSNAMFPVIAKSSTPDAKMSTLIVPMQSGFTV